MSRWNPMSEVAAPEQKSTRFMSFGYKLMISYLLLTLVHVVAFGYFANLILVDSVRKQTSSNVQAMLRQMMDNIQYRMEDTIRLSDMVYYDDAIATRLRQDQNKNPEKWYSHESTTLFLLPRLESILKASNRGIHLEVFLRNETIPEIYNTYGGSGDPLNYVEQSYDVFRLKRVMDERWYKEFPDEHYGETMQWKQIGRDAEFGDISLLRRLIDTATLKRDMDFGFLRLTIKLTDLFESVTPNFGEGTSIRIEDVDGMILYEKRSSVANLAQDSEGEDQLTIIEPFRGVEWKLVANLPKELVEKDARKVKYLTVVICIVSFFLFLLVGVFLSRYFSKRVSRIVKMLESFRHGDFQKRIYFKGRDEFTTISESVNSMVQHIEELIQEVYVTSLKKKEAELESLQAQINPHFLYNTLSSISLLAKFGKVEQLHGMVSNLALFYRLSLNEGRTIIPIANELEQAKAYMDIQKVKYVERLDVLYEVEPELLRYEMVKLLLQPFLENVLKHAWCGDRVHIRVTGRRIGGDIEFRVIDDGVGMTPETLRRISASNGDKEVGYGIRNVEERIHLHYGKPYGVFIHSRLGIGTVVLIRIPCIKRTTSYVTDDSVGTG